VARFSFGTQVQKESKILGGKFPVNMTKGRLQNTQELGRVEKKHWTLFFKSHVDKTASLKDET